MTLRLVDVLFPRLRQHRRVVGGDVDAALVHAPGNSLLQEVPFIDMLHVLVNAVEGCLRAHLVRASYVDPAMVAISQHDQSLQ